MNSNQRGTMRKEEFDRLYDFHYSGFEKLCTSLGSTLNGRKDRFDKSDLIERGIEAASGGALKWVDEEGYDLFDVENNLRYEVKSQERCLFTRKKGTLKENTGNIKLTNTLQQGEKLLNETADYLILVDTNTGSIGITSYKTAIEYSTEKDDGFSTKIPLNKIEIINRPTLKTSKEGFKGLSYKNSKEEMQKKYVRGFFNEEN